jgi:flagellar basal-body rod modification protein FlgD
MAAGVAGIWNQLPATSAEARVSTMSTATDAGGSGDSKSVSIAANDFLTLLVTEMKNQDPTATTDPNEYVNQLVQVNSLQQLISINETLQNATSTTSAKTDAATPKSSGALNERATATQIQHPSIAATPERATVAGNLTAASRVSGASRLVTALSDK